MLNRKGYWPGNQKKGRNNPAKVMRQVRGNDDIQLFMSSGRKTALESMYVYIRRYIFPLVGLFIIASFASPASSTNFFVVFAVLLGALCVLLTVVWILGTLRGIVAYFLSKIF